MDIDPAEAGVEEREVAKVGQADVPEAVELDEVFNVDVAGRVHSQVEVEGLVSEDRRELPRGVVFDVRSEGGSRFWLVVGA